MELQFCRLPVGTPPEKIVTVWSIEDWKLDSLYIADHDMNLFYHQYGQVFADGIYNNLRHGAVDMWGINYYASLQIDIILNKLAQIKPVDYESLAAWLIAFNGFYILGI